MIGGQSLAQRLTTMIFAAFLAIWLLAVIVTALVLRAELEELYDLELRETAQLLRPVLAQDYLSTGESGEVQTMSGRAVAELDESLVWQLIDRSGTVLLNSPRPAGTVLPVGYAAGSFATSESHRFFTTGFDENGFAAQVGDSLHERFEALRDGFLAFLVPMLGILPLGYVLIWRVSRLALKPLERLGSEIEARSLGRLDPLEASSRTTELTAITATLNGFMARLAQSLEGERAFATNVAHELRTPVAVALAQVQRLRVEATDPETRTRIDAVERALKRMGRLVERLLQLARAEAGIGLADKPHDLGRLLELVLADSRRDPSRARRLVASLPDEPVMSRIDPDAFAIAAGNLIENAFQHSGDDATVRVALSPDAVLTVSNPAPAMTRAEVENLGHRFRRGKTDSGGFGLGLHISATIARQAGGRLVMTSTPGNGAAEFEARIELPGEADGRIVTQGRTAG